MRKRRLLEILNTNITDKNYIDNQKELANYLSKANIKQLQEYIVLVRNNNSGDLNLQDGIDCKKCKNKSYLFYIFNNMILYKDCECRIKRTLKENSES